MRLNSEKFKNQDLTPEIVKVGIIHQLPNEDLHFTVYFLIICQVDLFMTKVGLFDAHGGPF